MPGEAKVRGRALGRLVTRAPRRFWKRRVRPWRKRRAPSLRLRDAAYRATYRHSLAHVPSRSELPHLLNRRGLRGRGVEIGVSKGNFSDHILRHWRGAHLVSVDPWFDADEDCARARRRLAAHGSRSSVWRLTSEEASEHVASGSLDFVYIDGDHHLHAVRTDLRCWYGKVRAGGLLAGHDYFDRDARKGGSGVKTAVDEFAAERGLTVHATFAEPVKTTGERRRQKAISWLIEVSASPDRMGGAVASQVVDGDWANLAR